MFKFKWSIALPAGVLVFCAAWGVAEWRRYTVQNQLDALSKIGFSSLRMEDYAKNLISQAIIPQEVKVVNIITLLQDMTYQRMSEYILLQQLPVPDPPTLLTPMPSSESVEALPRMTPLPTRSRESGQQPDSRCSDVPPSLDGTPRNGCSEE